MAETAHSTASAARHFLLADVGERGCALLAQAEASGLFDIRLAKLRAGDYLIDDRVLVERKTRLDFAQSLIDGRLFPQIARLARQPYRPLVLIEGPRAMPMPRVHPHALKGAVLSISVEWRVPVVFTAGPEESLLAMTFLARHSRPPEPPALLRRYDRKPRRLASMRLHLLQALPGVGPVLGRRLLSTFGSVEGVLLADQQDLAEVPGIGASKARRIRQLLSDRPPSRERM